MKDAELIKWFEFLNRGVSNPLNLDAPNIDNDAGKPKFLTSTERLEGKITKIIRILEGSGEEGTSSPSPTLWPKASFASPEPVKLRLKGDSTPPYPKKVGEPFSIATIVAKVSEVSEISNIDDIKLENAEPQAINGNSSVDVVGRRLNELLSYVKNLKQTILEDEEQKRDDKKNIGVVRKSNIPAIQKMNQSNNTGAKFVHWGDDNWNLILNMMLGIQKAVKISAATVPIDSEVTDEDFIEKCKHQLVAANEASQGQVYKFRDYAPSIFERIRRRYGITSAEYITSLGVGKLLNSLLKAEFTFV